MRILHLAPCLGLALAITPLFLAAQSKSGKELFAARCAGCHAMDQDKEGPRLAGVYGRRAASVSSFRYSNALAKSKLVWEEETLDRWLSEPDKLVPDNDMDFRVENAEERRKIIEFLKQQTVR
jgi:cytochrome c